MEDDKERKASGGELPLPGRPSPEKFTTWGQMGRHWPKTTFLIISNEFCERFSYYGMRTVLTFYILNVLKFNDDTTTIFFNSFTILCYLTPILGSIVADGYIGKFWTIFIVSIVYAIGQIMLAISSIQSVESSLHPILDLAGLVVIGFGTGGIKPCVAPFGADQFDQKQDKMLSVYFSMFYFSINAGSMISTFISPIFRAQPCLDQDSCYPLCFGIPAVLMLVATGFFMAGSFWYKKPKPKGNVFSEVAKIIGVGVYNAIAGRGPKRAHVIEHYLDTHDCSKDEQCIAIKRRRPDDCHKAEYVSDVQSLLKVLVMFLPVPMFWALYDQQGSIWLLQGIQMDCSVGSILLLPDQMQTLNAVLILLFIPLFQAVIYPICEKFLVMTPLRKMVAGGWLAALSFLVTGLVQLQVNTTLPSLPDSNQAYVSFANIFDNSTHCGFNVSSITDPRLSMHYVPANSSMVDDNQDDKNKKTTFHIDSKFHEWSLTYDAACGNTNMLPPKVHYFFTELTDQRSTDGHTNVFMVAIGPKGAVIREVDTAKPTEGTGEFSVGLTLALNHPYAGNMAVCRMDTDDFDKKNPCNPRSPADFYFWEIDYNQGKTDFDSKRPYITAANYATVSDNVTDNSTDYASSYKFKSVKPGVWGIFFMANTPKDIDHPPTKSREETIVYDSGIQFENNAQGGVYSFIITGGGNGTMTNHIHVYQVVLDNKVNILWQVPQIVILTAAEILFSITGYEFAYSQSAPSMKSVVQAAWLLTTAIGDSIIVGITAGNLFSNMATEFFAYAGAMFVVICIFALMSVFYYEYTYFTKNDDEDDDSLALTDESALDNYGFVADAMKKRAESESESSRF